MELDSEIGSSSKSAHLRQVEKTLGEKYEGPDTSGIVVPPVGGEFVWEEFWRIRRGEWLSFAEIESYCRLTEVQFSAVEIEALRQMDIEVINWRGSARHSETGNTN